MNAVNRILGEATNPWYTDPDSAYHYAVYTKSRVPEGEPYIAKDPKWAFYYAHDVIKGRWPEAEPYLANTSYADHYARYVIGGRWPEAEPYITKRPESAYWYALKIIKGRWPECEDAMAKDPFWACMYAIDVLKGRFREGEEAIAKSEYREKYLEAFPGAKDDSEWIINGWTGYLD